MMKIKKLSFFILLLSIFSSQFIFSAQNQNQNQNDSTTTMGTIRDITQTIANVVSIAKNGQELKQNVDKQETDIPDAKLKTNNSYLKNISDTQAALANAVMRKDANQDIKREQARIDKALVNWSRFLGTGKIDKDHFDVTTIYPPNDSEIDADTTQKDETIAGTKTPKAGIFSKTTAFMAALPLMTTDAIANTLPINAALKHMAQSAKFKDSFLDTHQQIIGRAAALGIMAGVAGVMYKTYTWYTNQDRILAQETVIELEEQQKELAKQFAKEIKKSTLSAEEKAKLQHAYESYMEELEEAIEEQKITAGYGIPKKLLLGALTAVTGLAGLTALAKHYLAQKAIMPSETTNLPQVNISTNTSDTPPTTETPAPQTSRPLKETCSWAKYNNLAGYDWLYNVSPEERQAINNEKKEMNKAFFNENGYYPASYASHEDNNPQQANQQTTAKPENQQVSTEISPSTTTDKETPPSNDFFTQMDRRIEAIESTPQIVEGKKNSITAGQAAIFVTGLATVGAGIGGIAYIGSLLGSIGFPTFG